MSEKLKPNFTPIPNIILDQMMRMLAPGATKVLFAICRFTYGWGKQSDRISLSQLQEITGMARGSVARSIKDLGDIVTVTPGTPSQNQASEYRLNVEIPDKDLVSLRDQPQSHRETRLVSEPSLIKRPSKDIPKKEEKNGANAPKFSSPSRKGEKTIPPEFEPFYSAYPRHVAKADALKAWLKLAPSPELVADIMAGVERYAETAKDIEPKYIKYPASWLNARRWEDESVSNGIMDTKVKTEPKDIGNGMVEFDGLKMTRATYERKHGTRV